MVVQAVKLVQMIKVHIIFPQKVILVCCKDDLVGLPRSFSNVQNLTLAKIDLKFEMTQSSKLNEFYVHFWFSWFQGWLLKTVVKPHKD